MFTFLRNCSITKQKEDRLFLRNMQLHFIVKIFHKLLTNISMLFTANMSLEHFISQIILK